MTRGTVVWSTSAQDERAEIWVKAIFPIQKLLELAGGGT